MKHASKNFLNAFCLYYIKRLSAWRYRESHHSDEPTVFILVNFFFLQFFFNISRVSVRDYLLIITNKAYRFIFLSWNVLVIVTRQIPQKEGRGLKGERERVCASNSYRIILTTATLVALFWLCIMPFIFFYFIDKINVELQKKEFLFQILLNVSLNKC